MFSASFNFKRFLNYK